MYLSIGKVSKLIGVSISTLRRWDKFGKLKPVLNTIGGHRRYEFETVKQFFGNKKTESKNEKVIAYARVSSVGQKEDLERQINILKEYCDKNIFNYEIIEDLGSGMNYNKKGLKKLLTMILSGHVSKIILTHKDRLLRFGSELLFYICKFFGVEVKILGQNLSLTDEQILAFDVLEIITVFSARLYGKRSHQSKKLLI